MNKKKLVVFDMDDTLITSNTWLTFNTFLGVTEEEDYALYTSFANKEFDYQKWLEKLIALYGLNERNISKAQIDAVLTDFTLAQGATEAVTFCKENNLIPVIITGSFKTTAEAVAKATGVKYVLANTNCVFDRHDTLIHLTSFGDEGECKIAHLTALCSNLGIDVQTECIAVGDSSNDIPLFEATDSGITFTWAKPEVKEAARGLIDDLTQLPTALRNCFNF